MFDKVKELITNYVEVEEEDIKSDSRFIEDLGFNSYDLMCLMGEIEDELEVEINPAEVVDIKTVGQVVEKIGA